MVYNCIIKKEGNEFIVSFPDLPNVITCGFSHEEALSLAKEALDGCLEADFSSGISIPSASYKKGYPINVSSHIALSFQLRELRGEQKQSDIAQKLGISAQAYQRLENPRKANPTVKTLEKIAHVYGRELSIVL